MKRFFFFLVLASIMFYPDAQSQTLKVGDAAPPIKGIEWLKGGPITAFQKDQVYLVEFTGSQCVPCRLAAPHLSNMAKEFKGKLTVMGICVGENFIDTTGDTSYISRVRKFVSLMGTKMDYNVAVDGPESTMLKTWQEASNHEGVPCGFIVDQNQKIAWIGLPADGGPIIRQLLDKKLVAPNSNDFNARIERAQNLAKSGNYTDAYRVIDSAFIFYPEYKIIYMIKFEIMLSENEEKAYAYGYQLLDNELSKDDDLLLYMAKSLRDHQAKNPNPHLALAFCSRGVIVTKDSFLASRHLELMANVYFNELNNPQTAVQIGHLAVSALDVYSPTDYHVNVFRDQLNREIKEFAQKADEGNMTNHAYLQ